MPRHPFSLRIGIYKLSKSLGLYAVIGKKVTLPNLLTLRYSMRYLASSSSSVTIFCILLPSAISIAVSSSLGTLISSATKP